MIQINNLCKKYYDNYVINDLNITINNNEFLGIIGASGCGKSTLLNIIGQIDLDYTGSIYFDKIKMNTLSKRDREKFIRYNINYLFQNFALIDTMTVEENLLIGLEYTKLNKNDKKKKIRSILNQLELQDYAMKKIYTLSGGEQQRVALGRIMIKPGDIVLADEPTGNLDKKNSQLVINLLKLLQKNGKTIIVVTHSDYVANQCDRIINL
ncbi:MAG: ABC transporter ATP-binding protein [Bacilli bacterium]